MNKRKLTTILLSTVAALGFAAEKQFTVVVKNPSAEAKEDARLSSD